MKVVLSGAAGFIGSHLVEALVGRGDDVIALDNFVTGRRENLQGLANDSLLTVHEQDVTHPLDIRGPVDLILHFASPASPPDYLAHPVATLDVGTLGTRVMLELAKTTRARFLLASTSEVYGDPLEHPQTEAYWGHVNSIGPRSVYDEAKRCAEAYTMAYNRAGVNTGIARIFNTYGERMRPNDGRAVPNFISQSLRGEPLTVYGNGSQTRSLCYVSDLVTGVLRLAETDEHLPVNLGSPQEITVLQLAERIRALGGGTGRIEFAELPQDDPRQRCPDTSRAHRLLGWEPTVALDEGLARTFDWFKAHRDL